jgi:acetyl-CoA carboxylase carboxyltransferase component
MASELVVDTVVPGEELRAELAVRLRHAENWTRSAPRRHHLVSPV